MIRSPYFVAALLLLSLLIVACQPVQVPALTAVSSGTPTYTPRFEPDECQYEIAEGDQVECGYLIVPENRSRPDGPTIRVYVVNFKAKTAQPETDPVILVPGGPGATTLAYFWMMSETPIGEVLRSRSDTILIEHRGSNLSEPAFYCPEMVLDIAELSGGTLAQAMETSTAAYRACHDRLVAEGHNLSLYGPVETAVDIADLRLALGYDEVNVFGISWGTLSEFYLLRDRPEGIRSVIMDGVLSPEVYHSGELFRLTMDWLDALFQACAEDPVCNVAYPDLETVFYDTLAALRNEPVSVTVEDEADRSHEVLIDDQKYAHYVLTIGFLGDAYTTIPAAMMSIQSGDYESVAQGWLGFLAGRHGETGPGTWGWAMGLNYTDSCLQYAGTGDRTKLMEEFDKVESAPSLRDWAMTYFVHDWLVVCESWDVAPAEGSAIGEPVASDVPTLMLVSTFDVVFSPDFIDGAIERFSQGYAFELPVSHLTTLTPCGAELTAQFLENPNQAPDASCIEEITPAWVMPE